jgi:hypothetical protein
LRLHDPNTAVLLLYANHCNPCRHITGDLESEDLQQLLDEMQQQLDQEQQEALAASSAAAAASTSSQSTSTATKSSSKGSKSSSSSSSSSSGSSDSGVPASSGLQKDAVQQKRDELLGSNEQLRAAVGRSSADLKQQQAAAALGDASKEQLQAKVLVGGSGGLGRQP